MEFQHRQPRDGSLLLMRCVHGTTSRLMKVFTITVFLALAATSCATLPPQYENAPQGYQLNPKAAVVRIVEFVPSQDRDKYDEV
jgi:hypothetical protein